jgi:TRAP transporter TAXI family solute receptor
MYRRSRWIIFSIGVLALVAGSVAPTRAQDIKFFRIGTGSISGLYFPVGGLIASAISHPPGPSMCGAGGSCGVPGMVAVAQASRGSLANIRDIRAGRLEAALVQSDIAYLAEQGKPPFSGKKAVPGLRAIASLYPEAVHVVVRRDSPIKTIDDLKGRRVSLDLKGSGTRSIARMVLNRYGIKPKDLDHLNSQVGPAVDRLHAGKIDAFFFVGGFPAPVISQLANVLPLRLLPIDGERAAAIRKTDPFLSSVTIPASAYGRLKATQTLAVGALLVVSDTVREDVVYGVTRALWHPSTRLILDQAPKATRRMRIENALKGVAIPLHKGAARYYREKKMLGKVALKPAAKAETAPPAAPSPQPPSAKPGPSQAPGPRH